jgi:hypothetical protein
VWKGKLPPPDPAHVEAVRQWEEENDPDTGWNWWKTHWCAAAAAAAAAAAGMSAHGGKGWVACADYSASPMPSMLPSQAFEADAASDCAGTSGLACL